MSSLTADPNPAVRHENTIAIVFAAAALVLSTLPYIFAWFLSQPDYHFVGQAYNIVDYSVYLSWTRQAADGHFFIRNLFTTDPQKHLLFNILFLFMGAVVRITHLPIPIVFQVVRVSAGAALLYQVWKLYGLIFANSNLAKLTAYGLTALSSGFGFMYWPAWADNNAGHFSVDIWQPEAFTFLSLYTSVLFVVALLFIVTAFYCLVRGEQTGQIKYGIFAGLCGLVLGNIHSYDVLHIAAAWGLYLVVIASIERRVDWGRWTRALVAGGLSLPTTVYQYYAFQHDPIFRARALTPTLSPNLFYYAMGYGLVFILAVAAVVILATPFRARLREYFADRVSLIFTVCWAVAGLTVIYLPVRFQRKMAMGEHFPLCMLAGAAAAMIVSNLPTRYRVPALALAIAVTFPTNLLFLTREFNHISANKSEISSAQPYLDDAQLGALTWIRGNTQPGDYLLALPPLAQFIPGYCDRAVWVGHWSETPNYGMRLSKLLHMMLISTPDQSREFFIRQTKARYLVYPNDASQITLPTRLGPMPLIGLATSTPTYLSPVFSNKEYTAFRVNLPLPPGLK